MGSTPPPSFPQLPSVGDLASSAADIIPGADFILELVKDVAKLPALVGALIGVVEGAHPADWAKTLLQDAGKLGGMFDRTGLGQFEIMTEHAAGDFSKAVPDDATFWNFVTKYSVGSFLRGMLHEGLGVDTQLFDEDAQRGVNTIDTMLGFAAIMPYLATAAEMIGAALFGDRFGKAIHESLGKLAEEMGLTWAMGMTVEESFKTAVGASLEEGINLQKRGARLAWPQYKQLMKQHVFDSYMVGPGGKIVASTGAPSNDNAKEVMRRLLASSGFTDETIEWLIALSDVSIPVGDIAQLYAREIIGRDKVKELLDKSGYTEQEVTWLLELYIDKAETSAGSELRTTARQLFVNQLIGKDQYRTILTDVHFPEREVADDIRAVEMVHDVGRVQQSVTLIKDRYLHKLVPAETAIADLRTLNYSLQYASDLVSSWDLPPIHPKHGLNQSKLLSYFISGLLSESQVRDGLAALSVDQKTIDFLVANPSSANGARVLRLGPNMVLQAYVEGAVTDQQLPAMFRKVGVAPDDVNLWIDKAVYRKSHTKGTTTYTNHLSEGQIIACFKWGMFDENTAHERLMQLGFSPDDATLILEIENKGVFQPPAPPTFATLGQAVDYLKMLGYGIVQPTDPKVLAAESMLAQAGYSWTMPSTTLPGDGLTGPGGGGLIDPITGLPIPPVTGTPPPGPVQPPA